MLYAPLGLVDFGASLPKGRLPCVPCLGPPTQQEARHDLHIAHSAAGIPRAAPLASVLRAHRV
jgi:hypothetical protein